MEESLSKFMAKSAKRHDENSNLIKEIRAVMNAAIRNQGASIKTLEIQIGQMSKLTRPQYALSIPTDTPYEEIDVLDSATYLKKMLRERPKTGYQIEASMNKNNSSLADLGASVGVMPLTTFTNLGLGELAPMKLIVELADRTIKHPKGIAENILVGIGKFVFPVDFIILDMPEDVKVPLILGRPFLSTTHAKIDVLKRKITLRVGDDKITFKSIKPASILIKRVYVLGLRVRMDLDLEARLMGEALILNRSLDPEFGDFIELNDLNEPLELRRNQVNNL
ncbi:zinc finger, CCHC-type containing protein, partial [Tanacetum coccineum]